MLSGPAQLPLLVMIEHDGLMRVFWPRNIRRSDRPGVVVGWRNSTLDVFVIAILDDVDVSCTGAAVSPFSHFLGTHSR